MPMFVAVGNERGTLDVYAPGAARIGQGVCRKERCHFELTFFGLEESYHFAGDRLQKWGAQKLADGHVVSWREELAQ